MVHFLQTLRLQASCSSQNVLHPPPVTAPVTVTLGEGRTGSMSSPLSVDYGSDLATEAAELVRRYLIPCRSDSLIVFMELLKFDWFDLVYPIVERYRAGVMNSQQVSTKYQLKLIVAASASCTSCSLQGYNMCVTF